MFKPPSFGELPPTNKVSNQALQGRSTRRRSGWRAIRARNTCPCGATAVLIQAGQSLAVGGQGTVERYWPEGTGRLYKKRGMNWDKQSWELT